MQRLDKIYVLIILATITLAIALRFFFGAGVRFIFREDSIVETISALFFLLGGIMALWVIVKKDRNWIVYLIAVIGIISFLDEISFGMRVFKFSPPRLFDVRVDAIHDLIKIIIEIAWHTPIIFISILSVFAVLLFVYNRKIKILAITLWKALVVQRLAFRLTLVFALVIVSQLIDALDFRISYLSYIEEVLEMNAGLGIFLCSIEMLFPHNSIIHEPNRSS